MMSAFETFSRHGLLVSLELSQHGLSREPNPGKANPTWVPDWVTTASRKELEQ